MVTGNLPGESNAAMVRVPAIVFFAVTPIFVAIRIWVRVRREFILGWDDWTLMASYVCCLAVSILMMYSCDYGFGQHIMNLSTENRLMTLKLFYVAQIFYKITINLTKASIILLYLRILVQQYFRITAYVLLAIILAYMVATSASSIWQCSPIQRAWDKSLPGTCISLTMNWYANAGFSIATDVLIILLPQHLLWQSSLPTNQKVALMVVFALGLFVTVTSVLRMTTLKTSTTSPDVTYDIASTLWTIIEDNLAIVCACLPMCRLPLAYLFPSLFGTKHVSACTGYSYDSEQQATGGRRKTNNRRINSTKHFIYAGASHNNWSPYEGPDDKRAVWLMSKHAGMRSTPIGDDERSEDYILMPETEMARTSTNEELVRGGLAVRKTMTVHQTTHAAHDTGLDE
ncbi:uncharacterized protein BCR38DRAFT_461870 [Pseudomassariella vexata]|uniref:Integral membrane protein n=1 Tax=Pseudomassariella vexata TaxID=1141098 RepID=A0A1Y2D9G2_9PEZI|nr:uncharacterized protein BCR38DRAFT_461870 [Pseudomassariella vexata]ORY55910.1 integral membrane protein [Pseudomassariella vexata]